METTILGYIGIFFKAWPLQIGVRQKKPPSSGISNPSMPRAGLKLPEPLVSKSSVKIATHAEIGLHICHAAG